MPKNVLPESGYYRYPTLHRDTVVFISEDDLWCVSKSGGVARRLTSGLGECSSPAFSPDGNFIAFTGREEGNPEVYLMPATGGRVKRLTFLGGTLTWVLGWHNGKILFTTNAKQSFKEFQCLMQISPDGGEPESLNLGHGVAISFSRTSNACVIGRNSADAARWKRYKGGTAGEIWVDAVGKGNFENISSDFQIRGNFVNPMWLTLKSGARIFFVSDHLGVANIHSVSPDGKNLRSHTSHRDYFARYPMLDAAGSNTIVYHAGGDLFCLDADTNQTEKITVEYHSPRTQLQRKFVDVQKHIEHLAFHPSDTHIAVTARGRAALLHLAEGAITTIGEPNGARYRLAEPLHDGKHAAVISDASGEERLEVYRIENGHLNHRAKDLKTVDIGRAILLKASPAHNEVALTNHRQEVMIVNLTSGKRILIAKSGFDRIAGISWSPDGRYLAYSLHHSYEQAAIEIYDTTAKKKHRVTTPLLADFAPCFDTEGKYLYFLSQRVFDPVYDNLHFDLNFPKGTKPYLITLKKDALSPFIVEKKISHAGLPDDFDLNDLTAKGATKEKTKHAKVEIDFDGITERVAAFPLPEGRYVQSGAAKGKAFFLNLPIQGAMNEAEPGGKLHAYSFDDKKSDVIADDVSSFSISASGKVMFYESKGAVHYQTLSAHAAAKASAVDFSRVKLSIVPRDEWRQMYHEAWRLQKEQFWTPTMSGIDWTIVRNRYAPLIERAGARSEYSDIIWEMQGELGTSHCYEQGGDYRPKPRYPLGFLGADVKYEKSEKAYRIKHIPKGDGFEDGKGSALQSPGVNLHEGDLIHGVNGVQVSPDVSLDELLVNQSAQTVRLTVSRKNSKVHRSVPVKLLASEDMLRYRDWVNRNTEFVHTQSGKKLGYVHVPNMQAWGYAEFHRAYLNEYTHDGLIIDVRFNGGGHVSQLLLEKLNRKRLGYNISRWGVKAQPYPSYSVLNTIVALTNEFAGSDGDIFSHSFKMMKLGTLVGKRTWGGVIGIYPRHSLADGSLTTQPEFSFWFFDGGWGVENYGTDPDVPVDIAPQDYKHGRDPQLEKAIALALADLKKNPKSVPAFDKRPNLALPKLK
jgi:tricorn protease